jgi:transposase
MFYSLSGIKVYLVLGVTDMRKSVNVLSILVSEHIGFDPLSGHLFAFCNRRKNILKILYWERNGFCLWYLCRIQHKYHYAEPIIMPNHGEKYLITVL